MRPHANRLEPTTLCRPAPNWPDSSSPVTIWHRQLEAGGSWGRSSLCQSYDEDAVGEERIGKVQIEHRYEYIDKYVAVQSWPALSAPFILQKIFAARRSWSLAKLYRVQDKPEKESVGTGLCSRISLQGFVGVRQP